MPRHALLLSQRKSDPFCVNREINVGYSISNAADSAATLAALSKFRRLCWVSALTVLFSAPSFAVPILNVDGSGQLTGIENLEVRDTYDSSLLGTYDVTFQDGTCIDLFNGCDNEIEDLVFRNSGVGGNATAALLGALGSFLETPFFIQGCESEAQCLITIPIQFHFAGPSPSASGSTLWVRLDPLADLPITESNVGALTDNYTALVERTWAVFTLADTESDIPPTASVPEPATAGLLILGLAGMVRRKKRHGRL